MEKSLIIGDEALSCMGGNQLRAMMCDIKEFPDSETVSLGCRSVENLNLMFIGEPSDLPESYALVSNIHSAK